MYRSYAEQKDGPSSSWTPRSPSSGGLRDVTAAISARTASSASDGVFFAHLKHEAGVHRVQRVPVTESQGRIHTSAVGVLVLPEADEADEEELLAEEMRPRISASTSTARAVREARA